jgi:hypothetical protein
MGTDQAPLENLAGTFAQRKFAKAAEWLAARTTTEQRIEGTMRRLAERRARSAIADFVGNAASLRPGVERPRLSSGATLHLESAGSRRRR